MMTHSPTLKAVADTNSAQSQRDGVGSPDVPVTGTLLHGAAFVLLCLWTRTSPDRLRDQLNAEGGACALLGF